MRRAHLSQYALSPLLACGVLAALLPPAPAAAAPRLSEAAGWLSDYVRIDTSNPPGNERQAAAFLSYLLLREGIPVRLFFSPGGRANLYARLPAESPAGGALLLTHHMDVVPAGPGWTRPPFAGLVADERLWGRGTLDTKGLGVAHLAAFIELKRRRIPLARDVIFLAVADEELGGGEGMAWLVDKHPELFSGVEAVLNEGGSSRANDRRLLWWEVEVAQKRPLWFEVETRGRPGHASAYNPESALHQMIAALSRMLAVPQPYRVSPPVRAYFHAIAPLHQGPRYPKLYADIDAAITPTGPKVSLFPGLHKLFLDTVQVTGITGSDSINVIPGEATARVDCRLLPDTDAEAFLAGLAAALGKHAEVAVLLSSPPAPASPTGTPAWRAIEHGLGGGAPAVPSVSAGFTDSRHFRARGVAAYGVWPFVLHAEDAAGIHAADERIPTLELDRGVERMRRIVEAFARGD